MLPRLFVVCKEHPTLVHDPHVGAARGIDIEVIGDQIRTQFRAVVGRDAASHRPGKLLFSLSEWTVRIKRYRLGGPLQLLDQLFLLPALGAQRDFSPRWRLAPAPA